MCSESVGFVWRRSKPVLDSTATQYEARTRHAPKLLRWLKWLVLVAVAVGILFGFAKYIHLLTTLTGAEWHHLLTGMAVTFLRVAVAVALASLWAIPVGVMIGRNPRWVHLFQPIIQMAASFPASTSTMSRCRSSCMM